MCVRTVCVWTEWGVCVLGQSGVCVRTEWGVCVLGQSGVCVC